MYDFDQNADLWNVYLLLGRRTPTADKKHRPDKYKHLNWINRFRINRLLLFYFTYASITTGFSRSLKAYCSLKAKLFILNIHQNYL